jgi:oligoendopeptidase F
LNAQEHDRTKIPDQYKWDLTAVYPSDAAWQTAKQKLLAEIPKVREFQGALASSPQRMADVLEMKSKLEKEFVRLASYAGFLSDHVHPVPGSP